MIAIMILKIEKLNVGDIMIDNDNVNLIELHSLKNSVNSHTKKNNKKRNHNQQVIRDLHGELQYAIMAAFSTHQGPYSTTKQALGRAISDYIKWLLEKGYQKSSNLTIGFDIGLWNQKQKNPGQKNHKQNKKEKLDPKNQSLCKKTPMFTPEEKSQLISILIQLCGSRSRNVVQKVRTTLCSRQVQI